MTSTPQLFELTLDSNDWNRYQIEGGRDVSLPALNCDVCGSTWKSTGEAYPATELPPDIADFLKDRRVLQFHEFDLIRSRIRTFVPSGALLNPGASFGAFSGVAKGRFFDLSWNESWTLFLMSDVFFDLGKAGVRFGRIGIPAIRYVGKGETPDFIEPEALPLIPLSRKGLNRPDTAPCAQCGRQAGGFESFMIDSSVKIPEDCDLFRCVNNPGVYVVTERFADALQHLEISGCVLNALPTSRVSETR